MFKCFKWNNCYIKWNLANWKWKECALVQEILDNLGGIPPEKVPEFLIQNKKKKELFIEILFKIQGKEYELSKRKIDDIDITIDKVALVVKKVSGIDITTKI